MTSPRLNTSQRNGNIALAAFFIAIFAAIISHA
jgi:hypothetical protein